MVKVLLAFGANINLTNKKGKTPIDMCYKDSDIAYPPQMGQQLQSEQIQVVSMNSKHDSVRLLLKECGGETGRRHESIRGPKRTATKVFKRTSTIRKKPPQKVQQELVSENCVRERSGLESDWCMEVAKLYHETWTKARIYPAPTFSADLKDAAQLGSQVRLMRLLQMAGSRILTLDGGGMKGIIEVELLEQIENATGRKIVELFDWIVGTSVGGVIAAALVYGKKEDNSSRVAIVGIITILRVRL